VAERNRNPSPVGGTLPVKYSASGRPSIKQLMSHQGTGPVTDVSMLNGDFWPEAEPIEEFLEALHEQRGHRRTDPVA
jgi:hypothetical protein